MLQNISRDFYTNEQNNKNSATYSNISQNQATSRRLNSNETYENVSEENVASKINFINTISKLFTIQNIVIYILTFLISMVGLGPNNDALIAPFGLALVIASISSGVPLAGVFLASLLGTAIKFGPSNTLVFAISAILILLMVIIKKPAKDESVNEKIRLGGYLFFATLIVQLIYILFKGFLVYDFLVALMMSIVSYTFYKIFVNSISVISYYGIKKVFSVEEVIGASLIITIAISAIGNLSIFSFSIRNIICIFIVLMMGWRNGILIGGTSGITVGGVLGIIGNGDPMIIAAYAISGMIARLLTKFGKIGVIAGFALGNIIVAYSANGGANNIIMFQEILIASIGLLALPKKTKISIQDIIPHTKLLPEAGGRLEESADTLLKLNSITQTIDQMANSYKNDESYEKNVNIFQDELIKALDGLEGNMLYDDIYNNEGNIIQDLFDNLQENNIITENGLISVF